MEHTIYLVFAVAGCTLLLAQVVLQMFGMFGETDLGEGHGLDVDHDFDHDSGHGTDGHGNLFFGVLTFKALTAFAGVFGLTGLILESNDLSTGLRVVFASGAGFAAMLVVARIMVGLAGLQSSGTVDIRNAVGRTGTVYIRIPESNTGWGKVTVEVQGRSLELRAVTDGPELKSGCRISVVALAGDETLKVERI